MNFWNIFLHCQYMFVVNHFYNPKLQVFSSIGLFHGIEELTILRSINNIMFMNKIYQSKRFFSYSKKSSQIFFLMNELVGLQVVGILCSSLLILIIMPKEIIALMCTNYLSGIAKWCTFQISINWRETYLLNNVRSQNASLIFEVLSKN